MSKSKRNHKKEFKAMLILEVLRGVKSIAELGSEYDIHPNQIGIWKKKVLEELPGIFLEKTNNQVKSLEKKTMSYTKGLGN